MSPTPILSPHPPAAAPANPNTVPPAAPPHLARRWSRRPVVGIALGAALLLAIPAAARWMSFRHGHSLTDDAFVESHIVNVAPEAVSGRIVRFTVDENDRVEAGQVLAEIDPTPYRDQVELAKAKLATADAELGRQEVSLARLRLDEIGRASCRERVESAVGGGAWG